MTKAQKHLWEKLERLKSKRKWAPSVALEAEIKATADRIALLEAQAARDRRATRARDSRVGRDAHERPAG